MAWTSGLQRLCPLTTRRCLGMARGRRLWTAEAGRNWQQQWVETGPRHRQRRRRPRNRTWWWTAGTGPSASHRAAPALPGRRAAGAAAAAWGPADAREGTNLAAPGARMQLSGRCLVVRVRLRGQTGEAGGGGLQLELLPRLPCLIDRGRQAQLCLLQLHLGKLQLIARGGERLAQPALDLVVESVSCVGRHRASPVRPRHEAKSLVDRKAGELPRPLCH